MGIYGDWAGQYYESGIYTIPCNGKKAPIFEGWNKFCEVPPTEEQVEQWIKKYPQSDQIGLLLGPSTGKVAFDFDYAYDPKKCTCAKEEFEKDKNRIEKEIMELLPQTSSGKVGRKGWTRFYQWNVSLVNKNANRNGIRLFDFLSTGRQTIIPPSLHSIIEDKKIVYQWIDGDFDNAGELPKLSMEAVESIISLYSDRTNGQRPSIKDLSRHERIMYFILDALRVDTKLDRVAEMAIVYDVRVNGDRPYLIDKNYYDTTDALKNAASFVAKINKWAIKNDALRTKEEKKNGKSFLSGSWDHFFEIAFPETRKDIFSEETYIRKEPLAKWEPIKQYDGVLRSYARTKKLPQTHTVDELERWTFEKNDLKFLCDIPTWDEIDRIDKIAGSISSLRFSHEQIVEIFKHWGVHVFRRVKDSSIQNRCIILKGLQGFGKDTVVRSLLKDFKPYYESSTLPGTPKDVLEIVSRLLVVHIEEFEQTKNLDIGFLKSLITQPTSFFRESYGHSPNQKIMRPSFISTANVDDIFRDPTGNRRFIVIPVDKVTWDYPQDESLQVVAQWKALFEQGMHFKLTDETEAVIKTIIDEFTPESLEDSIVEVYRSKISFLRSSNGPMTGQIVFDAGQLTEMLCSVAKTMNCSLRRVQSALKSKGYSLRKNDGMKYFSDLSHAAEHKSRPPEKPF